ncbi:MAG: hypothetical protein FWC65_06330 [Treponema sp.]|nr:hypothetical protein [Treponema sp.]
MIGLKAGDIFTWGNYPLYENEPKSRRWLLYLGSNSVQAFAYLITTTTQHQYYAEGGSRAKNNHFKIQAGVGGLERESVLDLAFFETVPEDALVRCKAEIERKGSFKQDQVNRFMKHLERDAHIPRVVKKDICRYLGEAGFKVPKM